MCVEAQNALRVCCVLIFQALCHLTISGKLSNRNILEHGYSRCRYSSYENRLESLESPYQTFQRFLFMAIGNAFRSVISVQWESTNQLLNTQRCVLKKNYYE